MNNQSQTVNGGAEPIYEQRQWLQVTLSSIGDAVITTDRQGVVTFLNPVAQSLTGWTQEDAAGIPLETVFKIINEKTRLTVENPATRALREGLIVGLANHTLLVAKNGTERAIDDSAAPIRNESGEIAGVVLVFRDVTERRQAERALRESEERFRLLVEAAQDYAIFMLDPQGRIESWNAGAERIKGYRAAEIIGHHFSIFYPVEAVESRWPERELEIAAVEGRFEDEGWRLRKDGSRFWANVVITALRDEDGDLKGFSKITRDLTERMQKEVQLRESENRFRRLFETAKDGILILDFATGQITDANPFISELLGYSSEELLGKQLWQIGLSEDIEASQAAFRQLQEQGYIRYSDLRLQTREGRIVEVEFVSNVYKVDHEAVIQCNIRDITERRQLLRASAQAEVSADLHRRKDEFLAMLSHELRNPLAAIMSAVHVLDLQKHEHPIQEKATGIIKRQVGHLTLLVNELLEVSRVLSGGIKLQQEDADMRAIVQRALETARPLIDEREHEVSISLSTEPIWVHADSIRLEEVIVNLLNNAAKYTPQGGRISLSLQKDQGDAVLSVKDTGVGIDPELLPHVFDLFTQAPRSLDRSQAGLGVGLTVVRKLVELQRGTVEAHSKGLGQGSEFIVRLPLLTSTPRLPDVVPDQRAKRCEKSFRVLVVDDNSDAADSVAILLGEAGHEVRVAYSGNSALQIAVEYRPDVVLLDIGLPEMDGYEVARRLRQQVELKHTKLIALTGYGRETDRQRSKEAGFDYHLVKPVDLETLQQLLERILRSNPE